MQHEYDSVTKKLKGQGRVKLTKTYTHKKFSYAYTTIVKEKRKQYKLVGF